MESTLKCCVVHTHTPHRITPNEDDVDDNNEIKEAPVNETPFCEIPFNDTVECCMRVCVTNCVVFCRWCIFCARGEKGNRMPANRLYIYFILITSPNIPSNNLIEIISLKRILWSWFSSQNVYTSTCYVAAHTGLFTEQLKCLGRIGVSYCVTFVEMLTIYFQHIARKYCTKIESCNRVRESMALSHHFMIIN